ncbi:MAG: tetratricopeptide repeat protein [Candidatus Rokubacteria bacterium]|nr:tetratricopeptide repeat protein [Candidatus Rokubacteria bacterium]
MSRLMDILARLDRRGPATFEMGRIGGFTAGTPARRGWRMVVALAILVAMVAIASALALRPTASTVKVLAPEPRAAEPTASPVPEPGEESAALARQAATAVERGALTEAAVLLERSLDLRPHEPETWTRLGVVLLRLGQQRDAERAFRRALALEPQHVEANRHLAVLLDRQGHRADARRHYQAYLAAAGPDDADLPGVRRRLAELARSDRR